MLALIQALQFKTLSILQDVRKPDILADGDWGFAENDGAPTIFVPGGRYGVALRDEIEVFAKGGITREQFEELHAYGEECSRALADYEDVVAVHARDLGDVNLQALNAIPRLRAAFDRVPFDMSAGLR